MNRPSLKPIIINRMRETELDAAIADLEKRGYVLVKRGKADSVHSQFKYKESSFQPIKHDGLVIHRKCWAVMRKKEEPK